MALLALLIATPLALSACSSNAGSSNAPSRAANVPQAAKAGAKDYAASGSGSSNSGSSGSAQSGSTGTTAALAHPGRSLIITAGLQVKTSDAAASAANAQRVVQAAGGFVSEESIGSGSQSTPVTTPGGSSSAPGTGSDGASGAQDLPNPVTLPDVTGASDTTQALLVLRVPPDKLDSVLAALAGKNDKVTYQSRTATDVTGQVADVSSRVASARAAIAELRTLIDRAASMNDLVSLEQALAQRESDLESLQAQQKALADQIQYATITAGYYSQGAPAAAPPVRTGFMRGLTIGWHGFTSAVRAVLVSIGWLVPYLVLAVVLWWPARRLLSWNRARRRTRTHGAPVPATAAAAPAPAPAPPTTD
jgi:hypothetical protein